MNSVVPGGAFLKRVGYVAVVASLVVPRLWPDACSTPTAIQAHRMLLWRKCCGKQTEPRAGCEI